MSEIIIIGIGKCGVELALEFIKQLNYDHCLDNQHRITNIDRKNNKLNVCYNENSHSQYIPRCLFVDLDPKSIDRIHIQKEVIINPNDCFAGKMSSNNNFAIGKYTEGAELFDKCRSRLDQYFEKSENLAGMILFFSTAGGSGSGIASSFIQYFRENDPCKIVYCNPLFPVGVSQNLLQTYNTIFTMQNLIEITDYATVFDNQALEHICSSNMIPPSYEKYNQLIAESLIQKTASYRFPGLLNGSMKKTAENLIPFPRMHFFSPSYMPILEEKQDFEQITTKRYKLCSIENNQFSQYITYQLQLRGSLFEMPDSPDLVIGKNCLQLEIFQFHSRTQTQVEHRDYTNVIGLLGNSKSTGSYFEKYSAEYLSLFRQRAFVHVYTQQGMDEFEFSEAANNVNDLIAEYNQYNDVCDQEEEYDIV